MFRVEHVETDDDGDLQTTTLLGAAGETLKRVHRVMPFGLHSSVPKGAHGMGLQFGSGGRLLNAVLGMEHPDHRPKKREVGSTALYDANGSIISLVEAETRHVHAKKIVLSVGGASITITDGKIILKGEIHLGGEGGELVHRKGDTDSDGDTAQGSATKVYAV